MEGFTAGYGAFRAQLPRSWTAGVAQAPGRPVDHYMRGPFLFTSIPPLETSSEILLGDKKTAPIQSGSNPKRAETLTGP